MDKMIDLNTLESKSALRLFEFPLFYSKINFCSGPLHGPEVRLEPSWFNSWMHNHQLFAWKSEFLKDFCTIRAQFKPTKNLYKIEQMRDAPICLVLHIRKGNLDRSKSPIEEWMFCWLWNLNHLHEIEYGLEQSVISLYNDRKFVVKYNIVVEEFVKWSVCLPLARERTHCHLPRQSTVVLPSRRPRHRCSDEMILSM